MTQVKTIVKSAFPSFDEQAETYDQRVGLSPAVCREIVQQVLAIAQVNPGDMVLEIGAGTGQIGQCFAQYPVRYIGFDRSLRMLEKFRQRLIEGRGQKAEDRRINGEAESDSVLNPNNMTLLSADGNQPWFPDDGTTRVIFSSRAIHWLAVEHIVQESFRIAKPDGATLLIGRIQRQKESVKARLQQEIQRRLRQHGLQPRGGEHHQRQLIEVFTQRGAKVINPVFVAQWTVTNTPEQSIKNWQQKQGLGGINLPTNLKHEILTDLQNWAKATLGELNQTMESKETYVLQGVRLC